MKIKLVVLFLMLTSSLVFTQQASIKAPSYVLLMRLQTFDSTLAEMEKAGLTERVAKRKKEIKEEEGFIVRAYKEYFNFCPVYYFYSSDSKAILSGKYAGKILNDQFEPVDFNPDPATGILLADYGIANPTGETYRYNNDGIKVNYIQNGAIKGFRSDRSYAGVSRGLWIFLSKYQRVARSIKKINDNLSRVQDLRLGQEQTW